MAISYKMIRTPRQWKAATGVSEKQFIELSKLFARTYEDFHEDNLIDIVARREEKPKFSTYEDLLFSFCIVSKAV